MAKVNVTTQDMETVGHYQKGDVLCEECIARLGLRYIDTPIFRKTADEYGLTCIVCEQALAS